MNPFSQGNINPSAMHIKKYMFSILKERYSKNEELIAKLIETLKTPKDIEAFGKFIADIYEIGFLKSLAEHKAALESRGLEAKIVSESLPIDEDSKIFR